MRLIRTAFDRMMRHSLAPITRRVLSENLTYLSTAKLRRLEKAVEATKPVPGDVLEFGVALGGSAIILASMRGPSRRLIGFDVFAMIPPPTSDKDDARSKERYKVIEAGESTGIGGEEYYGYRPDLLADVKRAFERHGLPVDGENIVLVKGLFEETWGATDIASVSLAHIDCDWYDPVAFCLKAVSEKIAPGGIIVLDDYHDYGGCRTAVDEFRAARPDFTFVDGANPFLVKA